ncbi:MAG: hypothetical protein R3A13_11820 [Bdellovibrionota bacterium]
MSGTKSERSGFPFGGIKGALASAGLCLASCFGPPSNLNSAQMTDRDFRITAKAFGGRPLSDSNPSSGDMIVTARRNGEDVFVAHFPSGMGNASSYAEQIAFQESGLEIITGLVGS